jgi:hypothetical protein
MSMLALFLFAFAELRGLPHPDFGWPPPWLEASLGPVVRRERAWQALLGTFVLAGWNGEHLGTLLMLAGLRIWAPLLFAQHSVPRYLLLLPLVLSLYGYTRVRVHWTDDIFLLILGALLCFSALVPRRIQRPHRRPTTGAYAVLREAGQLRSGSAHPR